MSLGGVDGILYSIAGISGLDDVPLESVIHFFLSDSIVLLVMLRYTARLLNLVVGKYIKHARQAEPGGQPNQANI